MSEVKVNKISPRTNCGTTQLGDAGDTITVTGDLKSNSIKSASGSTITLGQSGDTIQLGCGASQTGFGRTGTVNWDTTAKTASFTAVSGNGYFVNTTSGAITMTLPASPSAGDIVAINDYARTFGTNNVTVNRNSSNIQGEAADATFSVNGKSTMFVYVDATKGWVPTEDQTTNNYGFSPVVATGGTETTCGDYKIHTFTSPGTFCVSDAGSRAKVDYLVVAGGGGGASDGAGAGGAGGYRESKCSTTSGCWTASPLATCTSLTVTATSFPITVGGGGAGHPGPTGANGTKGSNSVFSTITSTGGGFGGREPSPLGAGAAGPGGSGGGPRGCVATAGAGNTPPVSPPQGQPGGTNPAGSSGSAGGGGAGAAGSAGSAPQAGPGGNGVTSEINASPVTRAGGGGGGNDQAGGFGVGGSGGGGNGGQRCGSDATAGTTNTGGGGGGGGVNSPAGAAGGSGIVIIRYRYQ
jgi:hypothetical protein